MSNFSDWYILYIRLFSHKKRLRNVYTVQIIILYSLYPIIIDTGQLVIHASIRYLVARPDRTFIGME